MADVERVSNLRFMLRALRYRNYRLFFGGQIISLVGTWLSMVASSWLVYRLAGERGYPVALMLGLVGFAGQFPVFVLTPIAGVWIDRWDRHKILIATQSLSLVQSFTLAVLTLGGWITIWQVLALAVVQGLINALDVPARQSFVVEMVEDRDDLSNAIALNSSMVHSARLFGPAIAGYLIYTVGEGYCFLIDGFSYLAVLAALVSMRLTVKPRPAITARARDAFKEGLRYAFGFAPIRTLLLMVAITSLTAVSQATLMPIFAGTILGGGERTLGWLLGASGLGALGGSLYLASRRTVVGLIRVIAVSCAIVGVMLILFSLSRSFEFSLVLLVISGFALVTQMAASNTVLQTLVDDDKRGRVMALFSMAFLGVAPLGSLLSGAIATAFGAPTSLAIAGVICLVVAGIFSLQIAKLRPLIRPIYQAKGILPEIAAGIEATENLEGARD
jgi:MFS family permease